MDRYVADKEVAFAAGLLIGGREAVVLEFPAAQNTIKLCADHVLHDRADVPYAKSSFLPLLGLLKNVPNDKTQTARHV